MWVITLANLTSWGWGWGRTYFLFPVRGRNIPEVHNHKDLVLDLLDNSTRMRVCVTAFVQEVAAGTGRAGLESSRGSLTASRQTSPVSTIRSQQLRQVTKNLKNFWTARERWNSEWRHIRVERYSTNPHLSAPERQRLMLRRKEDSVTRD